MQVVPLGLIASQDVKQSHVMFLSLEHYSISKHDWLLARTLGVKHLFTAPYSHLIPIPFQLVLVNRACSCSLVAGTIRDAGSGAAVGARLRPRLARLAPPVTRCRRWRVRKPRVPLHPPWAACCPQSFSPASLRVADFLHVPLFPGGLLRVGSCLLIVLLLPERQVRRFEEGVGWPAPLPSRA